MTNIPPGLFQPRDSYPRRGWCVSISAENLHNAGRKRLREDTVSNDDVLDPNKVSDEQVSEEIRALGGDPEAIGQRGEAMVRRLLREQDLVACRKVAAILKNGGSFSSDAARIYARPIQKLIDYYEAESCDACGGTGKPVSGLACMCRGSGRMSDAAIYLRERLVEAEMKP